MKLSVTDSTLRMSNSKIYITISHRGIRNQKLLNFTKPGNPGVKFKNHFEKMLKALSLPKAAKDELGITVDDNAQPTGITKGASQGEIPSGATEEKKGET